MGRIPLALLLLAGTACPGRTEHLRYDISIDGSRSGSLTRTILHMENGAVAYETRASMVFKFLFLSFKYTFRGSETWEQGRLLSADGECDDNGSRHRVSWTTATGGGGSLTRNGKATIVEHTPWATSGTNPPHAEGRIFTLDPDTGLLRTTAVSKAGTETIRVGGSDRKSIVWKTDLPGDAKYWFDGDGTLLRQSWREQGRRVEIQLREITRD